ncbi:MAG: FliG C-terminal domain-containing protein [Elusimicrobiota bacterium]|nr:FliG C-terminal domain-containing protein [Elusimicrobiota bacterium]
MRWLWLAVSMAALPVGAAAAVDAEEAQVSERLAARARETLDSILGPGRSKVLIEVKGERSSIRTETTIVSPLDRTAMTGGEAARILDLPGYSKNKAVDPVMPGGLGEKAEEKPAEPQFTQKDHEQSERDNGFEIKQIAATVVLDTTLPEEAVREVAQLLPQLLRIDGSRGDSLAILRAPIQPAWKVAFASPESVRSASYVGAGVAATLLAIIIFSLAFVRAARVFATELGKRAGGGAGEDEGFLPAEPLPELVPGAPAGMLEAGGEGQPAGEGGPLPALGRRFDFLADREPADSARALAAEKPEDVAVVFSYLAQAMPDVASRLFSALPADLQAEASSALLRLRVADPDRLSDVEERLKRAVEHGVEGSERLGRILSRVPIDTRSDLLGRLTLRDHDAVADVERHLFTIEDLETLSAVELRRLIAAVPYEAWGFALRGVPAGVVDRVLAELPEGPRELVRDTLSAPQPRDKVLDARSKVLDARADLAAKGEIKLGAAEAGSELL